MDAIAGYTIVEKLKETRGSITYRGKRDDGDKTVIIRVLTANASLSEIAGFKHEYKIIKKLDLEGIVAIHDIIDHGGKPALVLEDFKGDSLKEILSSTYNKNIDINTFLDIAIKLSNTLGILHKNDIIHKNIKPQSILIAQNNVKITDFGIFTELARENENIYYPEVMLCYISPEQTGRMNRTLDYRTDIYSLGLTFYEMLTGTLPFKSNDPMEVIHAHIARIPVQPIKLNNSIPRIISEIIMKMLSKTAEERYQNCHGLMADLSECSRQLQNCGEIESFALGRKDIFIKFNIPQLLFGRDREIEGLMSAFDRVSKGGIMMMLVAGMPGIGKSSLINEIHKPVIAKRGYFITGKFDQSRRDIPYSAIIQAFQDLVKQILLEKGEKIQVWRSTLLAALGGNGKVISDVIPDIELIIGHQPDIQVLSPMEAQNRFNYLFKNFIAALTSPEHPIILFLDDLQWSDPASLQLIRTVITDHVIKHLLIIGAYRNNEVQNTHILNIALNELKKEGFMVHIVTLSSLTRSHVKDMLVNFFGCHDHETEERAVTLAAVIHEKTMGNPFFVKQFLRILYEEKILVLADPCSGWTWDIERIKNMQVTDNVVEFMAKRIAVLPKQTQEILQVCACIDDWFDPEMLSMISEKPVEEIVAEIDAACYRDIIIERGAEYRFYHDRIREAAYLLIPEQERPWLHLKIGRLIQKNTDEESLWSAVFTIVNHLNKSQNLITNTEERKELARLNHIAGQKAQKGAAFAQMFNYLKNAIALLEHDSWESDYKLTLSIYLDAVEAAYSATYFDEMEMLADIVLNKAKNLLDKVKIYESKIQAYISQNNLIKSITTGLEILKLLGVKFPQNPRSIHIFLAYIKLKRILLKKKVEDLLNIPQMTDPYKLAIIRIISKIITAAYLALPNMLPFIIFKGVYLSIRYGNAGGVSAYFYSCYGFILCGVIGDIESGYQFGKLALNLLDKVDDKEFWAKTIFIFNSFIKPWKEHWTKSFTPFKDSLRSGMEYGDIEFAAHSAQMLSTFISFSSTEEINKQKNEILFYHNTITQLKQESSLVYTRLILQWIQNLSDHSKNSYHLNGDIYYESTMLEKHIQENDRTAICSVYWVKTMLCFTFNNFKDAVEHVDKSEIYLDAMIANTSIPMIFFYGSLSRLSYYPDAIKLKQKEMLKKVNNHQRKMKKFSKHAPMNYLHKYLLVEAEIARVKKYYNKAMELYEQAIYNAHKNEYIQEEAISYECAARFYLDRGFKDFAAAYMTRAYTCYKRWGALAKVKHLEEVYTELLSLVFPMPHESRGVKMLDIAAVMKASQTLSSEVDINRLLITMMNILIENAGAEKGILLLEKGDDRRLYIEAAGSADKGIEILASIPLEQSSDLSISIVRYVHKIKEPVILVNAFIEGMHVNDPYITENKVKSLLCMPVKHKGSVSGILYLENNLSTHVFTPERLELLRILSSQAAISIENARLFSQREHAARLEREMEIAANIQTGLLPKNPVFKDYDISVYLKPADKVGGDYYDILHIAGRDWLVIGDVCGHGISAGLIMMMVQTAIDVSLEQNPDLSPSMLLTIINRTITKNIKRFSNDNKYMTITVMALHGNGEFIFSGLHLDLLVFRSSTGSVEIVETGGRWIGFEDHIEGYVKDDTFILNKEDVLLLFTDGIIEAWKKGSIPNMRCISLDMFGIERLKDIFMKLGRCPVEEIRDGILKELDEYECSDDVTLVLLRRGEEV